LSDLLVFLGFAAFSFGLYQIYPPISWLFTGAAIGYIGLLLGRET